MSKDYQIPDLNKWSFARTNPQTIAQRARLLEELFPKIESIAEICCGDCTQQWQAYRQHLPIRAFQGLDIEPGIVDFNRRHGIRCICGDALDKEVLRQFLAFEVIFFGPPLSVGCDGHHLLAFREVVPSYGDFVRVLLGDLGYVGTLVCICPKTTTIGDITWLHHQIQSHCQDFGLRLIHYTYSTLTGSGAETEIRLKYTELWFSSVLAEQWEVRESKPI